MQSAVLAISYHQSVYLSVCPSCPENNAKTSPQNIH